MEGFKKHSCKTQRLPEEFVKFNYVVAGIEMRL